MANNSGVIPNPLKQVQYTLDALGNRLGVRTSSSVGSDFVVNYSHNNINAYTTVGNETMQYDGNGNMLSDGHHTYQYNYRNRMISVDNGSTAFYHYDALDRRIRKTTATDTIQFFYRGIQCIEEQHSIIPSGEGQEWVSYIYGNAIDDILSMHRNNQDYYYHKNHLGSVMAITDSNGAIVETYDYDPYGTPTIYNATGTEIAVSTIGNINLFTGREYDYETGLYFFRTRTLRPTVGRFMQHDPLLYVDGYNLYKYVFDNPLKYFDPYGNIATSTVILIACGVGGVINGAGTLIGNWDNICGFGEGLYNFGRGFAIGCGTSIITGVAALEGLGVAIFWGIAMAFEQNAFNQLFDIFDGYKSPNEINGWSLVEDMIWGGVTPFIRIPKIPKFIPLPNIISPLLHTPEPKPKLDLPKPEPYQYGGENKIWDGIYTV